MATRSTIAAVFSDGTIKQVYCHWDGCPTHNGRILNNYYNTQQLAKQIVSNGAISALGITIGEKQDFDAADYAKTPDGYREQTLFYHRDRNEDLQENAFDSLKDYLKGDTFEKFNYIYIANTWMLVSVWGKDKPCTLSQLSYHTKGE